GAAVILFDAGRRRLEGRLVGGGQEVPGGRRFFFCNEQPVQADAVKLLRQFQQGPVAGFPHLPDDPGGLLHHRRGQAGRPRFVAGVGLGPEAASEFLRGAKGQQIVLLPIRRFWLQGAHFSSALPRRAATWRPASRSRSTRGHNCLDVVARKAAALPMRRVGMAAISATSTRPWRFKVPPVSTMSTTPSARPKAGAISTEPRRGMMVTARPRL